MRLFVWLPLSAALLAVAGAARTASTTFWLQPACRNSIFPIWKVDRVPGETMVAIGVEFDLAVCDRRMALRWMATVDHERWRKRGLFNGSVPSPLRPTAIPVNAERMTISAAWAMKPPVSRSVIVNLDSHADIVAGQHPPTPPTAARRTAITPPLPRVTKQKGASN